MSVNPPNNANPSAPAPSPESIAPTLTESASGHAAIAISEGEGATIGRYKLLQIIGEGGFGVVYMAEQTEPVVRRVALKIIKLGMDTRQVIARFEAERQALAMMDHPNIAKVLDAGATQTGRPYFVMELVKGVPITTYCDQHKLSTEERLRLFIDVCNAIQHAHQKGIIHRDIKPSNILVTLHDGKPVPKVIDFGIAKATQAKLTDKTLFTRYEQIIGTPAYMSPEQAEMSGLDIDTRTDIYSLGVLLYELLTGHTPFDTKELLSAGLDEMRRIIREQDPIRPSTRISQNFEAEDAGWLSSRSRQEATHEEKARNSSRRLEHKELVTVLRRDLDWIALKCLEKDRARRYETANGLALDLKRYLSNEPIAARAPTSAYKLEKWARRNKVAAVATGAVVAAMTLGITVSTWQAVRATRAERNEKQARLAAENALSIAETQRRRSERRRLELDDANYAASMQLSQRYWDEKNDEQVRRLLKETENYSRRGFEWNFWQRQIHRELLLFKADGQMVSEILFIPGRDQIVTVGSELPARVWDATTGKLVAELSDKTRHIVCAATDQTGRHLLTGTAEGFVTRWDLHEQSVVWTTRAARGSSAKQDQARLDVLPGFWREEPSRRIHKVAFSPKGDYVAAITAKTAFVFDMSTGTQIGDFNTEAGENFADLAFAPDGATFVTTARGVIRVHDSETARVRTSTVDLQFGEFSRILFFPGGRRFITHGHVWNADNAEKIEMTGYSFAPTGNFSADGTMLCTGSAIWSLGDLEPRFFLRGSPPIRVAALSPDGRRVATASGPMVRVWDANDERSFATIQLESVEHSPFLDLNSADISFDGTLVAGRRNDRVVCVWKTSTGKLLQSFPDLSDTALGTLKFSRDGTHLLHFGDSARVFRLNTGSQVCNLNAGHRGRGCAALSPDGTHLFLSSPEGGKIFNCHTGKPTVVLQPSGNDVSLNAVEFAYAQFSADGRAVITGTGNSDWGVAVWDAQSGKQLMFLPRQTSDSVALSDDGGTSFSAWNGKIEVHNVRQGEPVNTFHTTAGIVPTRDFTLSGDRVVTTDDRSVKLWDWRTGRELLAIRNDRDLVLRARIAADKSRLVVLYNSHLAIWDVNSTER